MKGSIPRGVHRDAVPVLREALGNGWSITGLSGRGHLRLVGPAGQQVVTGVHHGSRRHTMNLRADLRRAERKAAGGRHGR